MVVDLRLLAGGRCRLRLEGRTEKEIGMGRPDWPASVQNRLEHLHADLLEATQARPGQIEDLVPEHRQDARNLLQYLELRRHDVYQLQRDLMVRGLSSLGRCEPHVLATVEAAIAASAGRGSAGGAAAFEAGRRALDRNSDALFGPRPRGRVPRIMVTLPAEAATDYQLVKGLITAGMDVARINGAHDDPPAWAGMIDNVRKASAAVDRPCRISVDLPGPKLRTGPLEPGPRVVRLAPVRDLRGRAIAPATVQLLAGGSSCGLGPGVPVESGWLEQRSVGDVITLRDTRGSPRRMTVVEGPPHARAEVWNTTYLESGMTLVAGGSQTTIGELPCREQYHELQIGDQLWITSDGSVPAAPWRRGSPGAATIGCEVGQLFSAVSVGDRVLLDDGKFEGRVERVEPEAFAIRIRLPRQTTKLRAGKGINLPHTELDLPLVGPADEALIDLAAARADMLGVSFVRNARDVEAIQTALHERKAQQLGLLLKVELVSAFDRLPEILLAAMRWSRVGVMIARGDLAVEAGYERVAELQEEMLWLCEAARLPVVWATQVLDQMARTGRPSRAEITDAAMAHRAECVMLNKGPHVEQAVRTLDDILRRMSRHQRKKTPILRALNSWYGEVAQTAK
jgi:pyruvate kinase